MVKEEPEVNEIAEEEVVKEEPEVNVITEKETKGCDRLPPTAQRVILAESATAGTSIPTSPPPTIHLCLCFCLKNF